MAQARAHYDRALALYDPAEHRVLATRFFGQDARVAILSFRSAALWLLGYPEGALADADQALSDAREIGQAATLMFALRHTSLTRIHCGKYAIANAQLEELLALAEEKGAALWKAGGTIQQGFVLALTGKVAEAVRNDSPPGSSHGGQREQQYIYRCICRIWREPMPSSANSTTLGAALAKR